MQSVGPAPWPCNPALPATYPMRNHDGTAGLYPTGGMPAEAVLTPSADQPPEEVQADEQQQELPQADD